MKALIIENNANFLYGLESKLAISGISALTFDGSGDMDEIMHILHDGKPDFIITELDLPGFSGLEAIRKIKSYLIESAVTVPRIFVYTGKDDDQSKESAIKSGADYFFSKPSVSHEDLIDKIRRIIRNEEKAAKIKNL